MVLKTRQVSVSTEVTEVLKSKEFAEAWMRATGRHTKSIQQALLLRRQRSRGWQVEHLSAAAAGVGERCDWDPSSRTGGGRIRSRVVELLLINRGMAGQII